MFWEITGLRRIRAVSAFLLPPKGKMNAVACVWKQLSHLAAYIPSFLKRKFTNANFAGALLCKNGVSS
jgi:hypothetical protein